jgi:tetratricopeptide (TPR) repeat protein
MLLFDQSERDEAQLLCSQGVNEMQKGNSRKALDLLNKSLAIRTAIKDKTGQIECYNYIGTALMMGRQFQAGRDMCRKALNLADEIKDYGAKAHALYHIGQASIGMGDRNSGIHELKKARSLFSLSQDREGISNCNKLLRKLDVYDVHMLFEPTALITACMVLLLIVLGFSI